MRVSGQVCFGAVMKKTFKRPSGLWESGDEFDRIKKQKAALKKTYNGPDDVVLLKTESELEDQKKLPWAIYVLTGDDGAKYRQAIKTVKALLGTATEGSL